MRSLRLSPAGGIVWSSDEAHSIFLLQLRNRIFALSSVRILGPYLFKADGVTVTVITGRHCNMRPKMAEYEKSRSRVILQMFLGQQAAPAALI